MLKMTLTANRIREHKIPAEQMNKKPEKEKKKKYITFSSTFHVLPVPQHGDAKTPVCGGERAANRHLREHVAKPKLYTSSN